MVLTWIDDAWVVVAGHDLRALLPVAFVGAAGAAVVLGGVVASPGPCGVAAAAIRGARAPSRPVRPSSVN